jgi:mannitol-1-/sugar-/sorbitol-6-/2-deoxyglucose-6-phosphatase
MHFQAALFDMDGLLIDSEPLWQQAEIEALTPLGVPLTPELCARTVGLRIKEAIQYWQVRYTWQGPALEVVVEQVVARMIAMIGKHGAPMPGARAAVAACREAGLALALATSSRYDLAEATLRKLDMLAEFAQVVCADEHSPGKPHPDVFLRAAAALDVDPQRCLVFEDSLNGVIAAKAARATVVAVPGELWADDPRFVLADYRLTSLEQVTPAWLASLEAR